MRKLLLSLLAATAMTLAAKAQTDEQVLVFRHDGTVNLFYDSEIDSITFSYYDLDSIRHEEFATQIFHTADTTLILPIAEVDSVAFGNHNVIEFQPGVKNYTDGGREWIIGYDGTYVYYNINTPIMFLPQVGDVLFYGGQDNVFRYGLAAKALAVTPRTHDIAVQVANVELTEVFKQLFYAGNVSQVPLSRAESRDNVWIHPDASIDLLDGIGNISFGGDLKLSYKFVVDVRKHFYSADIAAKGNVNFGASFNLTRDIEPFGNEEPVTLPIILPLGTVLFLQLDVNVFYELAASLNLNFEQSRDIDINWHWERKNGEDKATPIQAGNMHNRNIEFKREVVLDGEFYIGFELNPRISIINTAGVEAKLRVGPSISGQLGMGLLSELDTYSDIAYGSAKLEGALKFSAEVGAFNVDFTHWGETVNHPFFTASMKFWPQEIPLFPEFLNVRSVAGPVLEDEEKMQEISVAAMDTKELPVELEVGFELIDENEQVVDSIFVEPVPELSKGKKAYSASFQTEPREMTGWKVRPVFHYAGHTVRYKETGIAEGAFLQPISAFGSNGAITYAASYPIIGNVTVGNTTYQQGAYIPLPDYTYRPARSLWIATDKLEATDKIMGTWKSERRTITFMTSTTGKFNNKDFTYKTDIPQNGDITLTFDDDSQLTFTVIQLTGSEMQIVIKKTGEEDTLTQTE